MAQLYLPADHTEADLLLAGRVAERVESGELYVAWTPDFGTSAPAIAAELRDPLPTPTDTLALIFQAVRELWSALLNRDHAAGPALPRVAGEPVQRKPATGEAAA
jgi:hypothetical protein